MTARTSDDFAAAVEACRRDVLLLCYRFMGSLSDAEEAAQETALRAWRARSTFRGDASLRTWLHRIAARVCLDLLRHRRGRRLPEDLGPAAAPERMAEPPRSDIAWLEPIPDALILGTEHDPAARYALRESVSLAFIAALQVLPARQRAVLLLRDVLGWDARQTAEALGMTVPAANSALHRARSALRATHHRSGAEAVVSQPPDDPIVRRLLDAYVRAWEADDVGGLVATMREDVRLAMPPSPSWYDGRTAVETALRTGVFGPFRPASGFRLQPAAANLSPAVIFGAVGQSRPLGLQVLRVEDGTVVEITIFLDSELAARFERPSPAS